MIVPPTPAMTPADYERLIDAETWAFIRRTEAFYPPDAAQRSIAEQRGLYDELCAAFAPSNLPPIGWRDDTVPGPRGPIPVRRYEPPTDARPAAQILFFHGGGYVVGSLESHHDLCVQLCDRTGLPVTAVDYALAPERTFPADRDDALAAFDAVAGANALPVILVGDSAGGNLAAAVAHARRGADHPPLGQVLIYPGLGVAMEQGSFLRHADAPMLTTADTRFYKSMRSGGDLSLLDTPEASPLLDADMRGVAPTTVFSAECDPLRDDGEAYVERLTAAGVNARFVEEAGLVHGYLRARHSVGCAARSFDAICAAITDQAAPYAQR